MGHNPAVSKEIPNSKSTLEQHEFVTKAIYEMVEAGTASALPAGVIPTVESPLGVVPKPHSDKLRLIVNMRYVNNHLVKRVLKFEGLSDIADMADKGITHCPLTSRRGIIMRLYIQILGALLDSSGRGNTASTMTYLLGCQKPLGFFKSHPRVGDILESKRN